MTPRLKGIIYLGSGGALLAWTEPPPGWGTLLVGVLLILTMSYLDYILGKGTAETPSFSPGQSSPTSRGKKGSTQAPPDRKAPHAVFESQDQEQVQTMIKVLREEGFHPILVVRNSSDTPPETWYQVRLPKTETTKAKPIIALFEAESSRVTN